MFGRKVSEGLVLEGDLKQDASLSKRGVNQDLHTIFIQGRSWSLIEQITYTKIFKLTILHLGWTYSIPFLFQQIIHTCFLTPYLRIENGTDAQQD